MVKGFLFALVFLFVGFLPLLRFAGVFGFLSLLGFDKGTFVSEFVSFDFMLTGASPKLNTEVAAAALDFIPLLFLIP